MINSENPLDKNNSEPYDIEIFNLTKIYKLKGKANSIKAIDNINLKVKKGEIFGLLGPNGAGKTTIVSILTTLRAPTSGYATILGRNILNEGWFVRENVGLMLGGEMIYYRLTGYRNLKLFCKLYGIKSYKEKINDMVEVFNLKPWINQYVNNYSTGMKIKLALARVLLIEPKVLFLDEPMLGLDPKSVSEIIKLLQGLKITIFFTSHQMDVISKLCKRIAFLKQGKILKVDSQENFKKLISDKIKIQLKILKNEETFVKELKNFDYITEISQDENIITFYIPDNSFFSKLFHFLKDYPVLSFNEIHPSLEDVFIKFAS